MANCISSLLPLTSPHCQSWIIFEVIHNSISCLCFGRGNLFLLAYFGLFLKFSGDCNMHPGLRTSGFNRGHGQML